MPTTQTHTAFKPGPVNLDVSLTAGEIRVVVDPNCAQATVTVKTADDNGPSADAVNRTRITDGTPGVLVVSVPRTSGADGVTVVGNGSVQMNSFGGRGRTVVSNVGSGVFIGGDNYGVVSTDSGVTIVNGQVISGGGTVIVGSSPITVDAIVPPGSSLIGETTSADVVVEGDARKVDVRTVSGDVDIEGVVSAQAQTTSGDIRVERLAGAGSLRTVSGDVSVTAVAGASRLSASTVSGDITTRGARIQVVDARSVSGRVRNR